MKIRQKTKTFIFEVNLEIEEITCELDQNWIEPISYWSRLLRFKARLEYFPISSIKYEISTDIMCNNKFCWSSIPFSIHFVWLGRWGVIEDHAWDSNYRGLDVLWVISFRKVNKKSKSKQYFRLVKIESSLGMKTYRRINWDLIESSLIGFIRTEKGMMGRQLFPKLLIEEDPSK